MLFVIDPRPYQAAVDRAKADLDSAQARLELGDKPARARAGAGRSRPPISAATLDERLQERRAAEAVGAAGDRGAEGGAAQPRLHQGARRRSPAASPTAASTSAISSPAIRTRRFSPRSSTLDPIYFVFDMSEARLPRLSARGGARRASLDPRPRDPRRRRGCRTRRTGRIPGTMNFVDNAHRSGLGHDPRARDLSQSRPVHHARPVRPAARAELERVRGDPHPRQRHRDRPVEPHRDDGRR